MMMRLNWLVGRSRSVQVKDADISDPTKIEVLSIDHVMPHIASDDKHQISIAGKDKHTSNHSSIGWRLIVLLLPQCNNHQSVLVASNVADLYDSFFLAEFVVSVDDVIDT